MKCKDKPFKSAEANAKSALKTQGVIDEYRNILDANAFHKANTTLTRHGKDTYGIDTTWFYQNDVHGDKQVAVPNKEAFEAVDFINGIKYNGKTINVETNRFIQEY
jgi:hypothetical protein